MNNNKENNYVAPTKVNLDNANLDQASDILNRERTNIVSATLQANNAIDESQAKTVNNAIKVQKRNPFFSALIVIICLAVAAVLIFYILKYTKKFVDYEEPTTTTTTTKLTMHSKVANYLKDTSKVRKFETSNKIIFLLPKDYDKVNNNLYYFYINKDNTGVVNSSYGTYTIVGEDLTLNDKNEKFVITEGGISYNNIILNIFDSEYKYYYSKSEQLNSLLLINGTPNSEISLYLTSNSVNTNIIVSEFTESDDGIYLSHGETFNKVPKGLVINGANLTLSS